MQIKLFRRAALGAALVAAPMVALGTATAGASAPHATTFKGYAKCTFYGTLTSTPGLTFTAKAVTATVKLTLTGCTGNISSGGVKITGATASATVHAPSASCSSLGKFSPTIKLTWKTNTGSATPTSLYFSSASATLGTPIKVTFPKAGGTSKATGSFAGTKSKATAVVQQSANTLLTECGTSKGVTSLGLTKASTITVQ